MAPTTHAGQIHDDSAGNDISVFRLEGTNLYITNGDDSRHKVTSNYVSGTRFEAKFVVSGKQVKAYYNGVLRTTISKGSPAPTSRLAPTPRPTAVRS